MGGLADSSEFTIENEDETDQAKVFYVFFSPLSKNGVFHFMLIIIILVYSALYGKQWEVLSDGS